MPISVNRTLDFNNIVRITNLPNAVADQEPATFAQLKNAIEGLAFKDNARVRTSSNISITAPGASLDGITMASLDRVLVGNQTVAAENGIYLWNGAAIAMTRALDASAFDELEGATITVDEGASAGTVWRQTAVNGTLGTTSINFIPFGTAAAQATESTAGVAEIATQAETDAGIDDSRIVTPLKLANSAFASRSVTAVIGDGTQTSYTITHNFNTRSVEVQVYRNSGNYDTVLAEVQRPTLNTVVVLFDSAPASNAFAVRVGR